MPPARDIPTVARARAPKLPSVTERMLPSGLRLLAVRRRGIPKVAVRLRAATLAGKGADRAREMVLSDTLLSGTERSDAAELAGRLRTMGGALAAGVDAEELGLHGSVLATNTSAYLELLAEVLTGATFPADDVAMQRQRLAHAVTVYASRPSQMAVDAINGLMFPGHPYGRPLPSPEAVMAVSRADLRRYLRARLAPSGTVVVLVGDQPVEALLDRAEAAFGAWSATGGGTPVTRPVVPVAGPMVLIDRPGAVQTTLRMAGPAPTRTDPGYPALAMATTILGGNASGRLFLNLRERHGWTYGAYCAVQHLRQGSRLTVSTDVNADAVAPALVELRYEMGRLATVPPSADDLGAASRYLSGTMALQIQTLGGLASVLSSLVAAGLGFEYLRTMPAALAAVTADEVQAAAHAHLAPESLHSVAVGDRASVSAALRGLVALEH